MVFLDHGTNTQSENNEEEGEETEAGRGKATRDMSEPAARGMSLEGEQQHKLGEQPLK